MHDGIRYRRYSSEFRPMGSGFAVLLAMLIVAILPGAASAAAPLKWSAPRLVDHAPYRYGRPGSLVGVSCVSGPLCVAVDSDGAVVTSIHPTGGTGAWTLADVDRSEAFSGVSCASASLCVAVERNGSIATSTDPTGGAGAWTISRGVDSHPLTAISCASTGSLCVAVDVAGDVVTSSDPAGGAGTWTVAHVDDDPNGLVEVSCPSAALCVAVSSHDDAGSRDDVVTSADPTGGASAWRRSAESGRGLTAVSCPGVSLCVGVDGAGGVATTSDPTGGRAWTRKQVKPTTCVGPHECQAVGLDGVSCPSASFCAAFDDIGSVLTSTVPAGGARAWKPAAAGYASAAASAGGAVALSCGLPSLCAYIEVNGEGAVTGAGTGDGTVAASTNPGVPGDAWHAAQIEGVTTLTAVSCPSASLCVAGDFNGDVVTSTDPTSAGSSWDPVHIDGIRSIEHVSCRSAALCVAVDDLGRVLTSSDPTGGPHAWHRVRQLRNLQITGVSCPSTSLCVAVGVGNNNGGHSYVATSTRPARMGTWIVRPVPQLPDGAVSCPSVSFCAAVGFGHQGRGETATSTDPRGGARAWRSSPLPERHSTYQYAVSCPSVSLCVAVDGAGSAFTTTNPRGRRPWRRTRLGPSQEHLNSVSCPSVHLCVASDDLGSVRSTTDPTGGPGAWTSTHVKGGYTPARGDSVEGVSCPSTALCAAVDQFGDVLLGTRHPAPGAGRRGPRRAIKTV